MGVYLRPLAAEFLGTAVLVFVGCGSVAIGNYGSSFPVGVFPVAVAFGGVLTGLIYALGPISGCHINPAVTLAAWVAGRFETRFVPGYILAQILGAIFASGLLAWIVSTGSGPAHAGVNLGQNGWGPGYLGEYPMIAAFAVELIVTAVFVLIIFGATTPGGNVAFAGVSIGVTLGVLLITFVNVSGCSLNPARSLGPALFVGGTAMQQVWLFIVAPCLGGALAGLLCRSGFYHKPQSTV